MRLVRNILAALFCVAALTAACAQSQPAAAYPSRPIKLIVPFPPGGPTDIQARLIAEELRKRWNAVVVVDNRPGGGTIIGTDALAKSAPDGYTLMLASPAGIVQLPWMQKVPYDPLKDLQPVSVIAYLPQVLAVPATSPIKSFADFQDYARGNKGKASYASVGIGSTSHIYAELLNNKLAADAVHIPYKGDAPAMLDLISGRVTYIFSSLVSAVSFAEKGNVRLLAVTGSKRLQSLPSVPTFQELGVRDFDLVGWYGILAPAGIPQPIADKLHNTLDEIYRTKAFTGFLSTAGVTAESLSIAEFTAQVRREHAAWGRLIRDNNIKLD
jgi:tripartite-type tricarboxylate transporter receptor subunit TctC